MGRGRFGIGAGIGIGRSMVEDEHGGTWGEADACEIRYDKGRMSLLRLRPFVVRFEEWRDVI